MPAVKLIFNDNGERYCYALFPDNGPGIDVSVDGQTEWSLSHADLAPDAPTSALRILSAMISIQGFHTFNHGTCGVTVGQDDSKWKMLAEVRDGANNGCDFRAHPGGILLMQNQEICLFPCWIAQPAGPSWRFGANSSARIYSMALQYKVEP